MQTRPGTLRNRTGKSHNTESRERLAELPIKAESRLWMRAFPHGLPAWIAAMAILATAATAQNTAPSNAKAPATAQQTADNEWLAKTAKVYYSSARAGLTGFSCEVHPDWRALIASTNRGAEVPANDPNLSQLKKVKVTMHARMKGGSTIEWLADASSGNTAGDDANSVMDAMHQTVQQMLEGFLQFWTPFMEVTVVPNKTEGLEITHAATGHTIHAKQGTTELTEIFNADLVLEHFNVVLAGTSIKFAPVFEPTPQGLLVKAFSSEILPAGATPQQMQKMQVRMDYQTVNKQTLPAQLNMEVVGTGTYNFTFDGCTTE
jgi:hypothetical protein